MDSRVRLKGTHIVGTVTGRAPDSDYFDVEWDNIGHDKCLPESLEKAEPIRGKQDRLQMLQDELYMQMYPHRSV